MSDHTCSDNIVGSLISNCKLDTNFLDAVVSPWEMVTGGLFIPVFWGVVVFVIYLRYHSAILSLLSGIFVLFGATFAFPEGSALVIPLLVGSVVGLALYYIILRSPGPASDRL